MKYLRFAQHLTKLPDQRYDNNFQYSGHQYIDFQASVEKSYRNLIASLNDLNTKIEEANLNLGDMDSSKKRLSAENAELLRQLQELQNSANLLVKTKSALVAALEEQKIITDN